MVVVEREKKKSRVHNKEQSAHGEFIFRFVFFQTEPKLSFFTTNARDTGISIDSALGPNAYRRHVKKKNILKIKIRTTDGNPLGTAHTHTPRSTRVGGEDRTCTYGTHKHTKLDWDRLRNQLHTRTHTRARSRVARRGGHGTSDVDTTVYNSSTGSDGGVFSGERDAREQLVAGRRAEGELENVRRARRVRFFLWPPSFPAPHRPSVRRSSCSGGDPVMCVGGGPCARDVTRRAATRRTVALSRGAPDNQIGAALTDWLSRARNGSDSPLRRRRLANDISPFFFFSSSFRVIYFIRFYYGVQRTIYILYYAV